jgi:pyrimidine operon attenuation protein/uracil phosphoribosyltransferase
MAIALYESDIARALTRVAHEIIERNSGSDSITLLGIPTRGAHLAQRLASIIDRINIGSDAQPVQVGTLDVTLHRDDLRTRAPRALMPTTIPTLGVEGRTVVLVDDVLFSGRTIRSALDAIGEIGRPARVQLAVLVDRGHRELPIKADYVGKNLPTSITQSIKVHLAEIDHVDEVVIEGEE